MERTRPKHGQEGMSLVELLLAAGVVATSLSILFGSLVSISVMERLNESRASAVLVLSSVMEEVSGMPWGEVPDYVAPSNDATGLTYEVTVEAYAPQAGEEEGGVVVAGEGEEEAGGGWVALPLPVDSGIELPKPLEYRVTVRWLDASGRIYEVHGTAMRGVY